MSRIANLVIYLLLGIAVSSCLPDPLEVEGIPQPETTVVVGSQNLPNEFLVVSLTENFNALEGGPETDIEVLLEELLIDGIEMTVETGGENYILDNPLPGIYTGNNVPEIPGAFYTLNFQNPFNGEAATATTQLLPFVGFDEVAIRLERTQFDTLINVDLRIDDPQGPNWYMINVQQFNDNFDIQERPFTELLEDSEFDGTLHDHSFTVFFRDYEPGDTVLVSMANIDEEYYRFLDLRNESRFLLLDGIGEPINYPSNVENGLGFFNLHLPDIRFFLPD